MDPISQGALGALVAQSTSNPGRLGKAAAIAALAAMAPDLDVLIQSEADPLLALEYHRHFTHSVFFAPVGGLLCAGVFYLLLGKLWSLRFSEVAIWSVLGFFTHGPLDLCTSYGTSLLWPMSNQRLSLDLVSVIDPLVTGPMLLATLLAAWTSRRWIAVVGLSWLACYLSIGALQQSRVESVARETAQSRGHQASFLRVMPTLGNLLVWRTVYEHNGNFFVDGVGAGPSGTLRWSGGSVPVADPRISWPGVAVDGQSWEDVQRFAHFTQGYMGFLPASQEYRVGDIRYAAIPNDLQPLWGIVVQPDAALTAHVDSFAPSPGGIVRLSSLWRLIQQTWAGNPITDDPASE
ncbi:MAG: metal-dependent hydrolase [Lysobacterales bacterium]